MSDPIREAQARATEFNAQAKGGAVWNGIPAATLRARRPEAVALEELVEATEAHLAGSYSDGAWHAARARLVLAMNAARNALQMGRVLDGIAADPSIGHGHVGSVG